MFVLMLKLFHLWPVGAVSSWCLSLAHKIFNYFWEKGIDTLSRTFTHRAVVSKLF